MSSGPHHLEKKVVKDNEANQHGDTCKDKRQRRREIVLDGKLTLGPICTWGQLYPSHSWIKWTKKFPLSAQTG